MRRGGRLALILLAATAVLSHYTPAEAQNGAVLKRVEGLRVFDSSRTMVGNVIDFGFDPWSGSASPIVAFRLQERLLVLGIAFDRIHAGPGGVTDAIRFETIDCTGTPFTVQVGMAGPRILPPFVLDAGSQVVYLLDGSSRQIALKSVIDFFTGGCRLEEVEQEAIPLRFLVDLKPLFAPPFSVGRIAAND